MGSPAHCPGIGQHILRLVCIAILTLGCPKPDMHIWFVNNGKLTREYKFSLIDGKANVRIDSFSSFFGEKDRYKLHIGIMVKFPKELKKDLHFAPESIRVLFANHLMVRDSSFFKPSEDLQSPEAYSVSLNYAYDMQIDSLLVSAVRQKEEVTLRIMMDNFISYKYSPLLVDTIYAVEKQTFFH
ncbi:MAG: hypothetical protein HRF51_01705 [bacterium]|jgi:hypothetical protein